MPQIVGSLSLPTHALQVGLVANVCWHNAMLTGLAFLSSSKLAIAAYDIDQLRVVTLDGSADDNATH